MDYDIYITEKTGGREMRIPWLPEKISFRSGGARFASYEILDMGDVRRVSGTNLSEASWNSTLPGAGRKDLPFLRGDWQDPLKYQQLWSSWRVNGTPLRLLIPNTPVNIDMMLDDYTVSYEGAYGDYQYTLKLCSWRELTVTSTRPGTARTQGRVAPLVRGTPAQAAVYTVKPGESLWSIAARPEVFGDGAQWARLYQANKAALDAEAARRGMGAGMGGRYAFPGTVIHIPRQEG